jgi:hypothetical protein
LLTFDDGLLNNWRIVFPLLKKFNTKAILFITPNSIENRDESRLSLDDVWSGRCTYSDLSDGWPDLQYISWKEAVLMESSGLVDIQSHTLMHQICFISPKIIDFQHPNTNNRPQYRWLWTAVGVGQNDALWGAPVYKFSSRMVSRRYFDDERLRKACIDFVGNNGGLDFFNKVDWRNQLKGCTRIFSKNNHVKAKYETREDMLSSIKRSLLESREVISCRLKKNCDFLALPWNQGNSLTLRCLKEAGYKANFSGTNPFKFARSGDNPYSLNRIEGYWIKFLPGKGRLSLFSKLKDKLCETIE